MSPRDFDPVRLVINERARTRALGVQAASEAGRMAEGEPRVHPDLEQDAPLAFELRSTAAAVPLGSP